ncbi:MAG: T9SS type A sorting domain-containing protein [Cytophagales bacterium]|nr:T9SS type A sorting domain-containing protein [Cytophagales bacterium]
METELAGSGVSYYPNPVTDLLTVRVANTDKVTQVDLISNTGVRLESATIKNNEAVIDMRNHPSGLYLIKLIGTNNSVSTFKILRK